MVKVTEQSSNHNDLHQMSIPAILSGINEEDLTVAESVKKVIPAIATLATHLTKLMSVGGRLFYVGAGTSGRLGVVDASECPPTFGVDHDLVVGLIAGGDSAIRKAVEFAEDDEEQAWRDLKDKNVSPKDMVIGIAASGSTPYVIGGLRDCQSQGISTGCITCNPNSELAAVADFPIECIVGPEFVTGSTRMKAGTAQKLILNMISTTVMIQLGKVVGNRMVDMQLSNVKLVDRGVKMILDQYPIGYDQAKSLLLEKGNVRSVLDYLSS